jgi:hypothetical protein
MDAHGFLLLEPCLQLRFYRLGALAYPSRLWPSLCRSESLILVDVTTFAGISDIEFLRSGGNLGNDRPPLGDPTRIVGEAAHASGCQSLGRVHYAGIRVHILLVHYSCFGVNFA